MRLCLTEAASSLLAPVRSWATLPFILVAMALLFGCRAEATFRPSVPAQIKLLSTSPVSAVDTGMIRGQEVLAGVATLGVCHLASMGLTYWSLLILDSPVQALGIYAAIGRGGPFVALAIELIVAPIAVAMAVALVGENRVESGFPRALIGAGLAHAVLGGIAAGAVYAMYLENPFFNPPDFASPAGIIFAIAVSAHLLAVPYGAAYAYHWRPSPERARSRLVDSPTNAALLHRRGSPAVTLVSFTF